MEDRDAMERITETMVEAHAHARIYNRYMFIISNVNRTRLFEG